MTERPELLTIEEAAEFTYCESYEAFRVLAKKYKTPYIKNGRRHLYDKKDLLELMEKMKQYPHSDRVEASSIKESVCRSTKGASTTGSNLGHQTGNASTNRPKLRIADQLKSMKTS